MTRIKKTRKTGPLAQRSAPKEERKREVVASGKKPGKHKGRPAGSRHSGQTARRSVAHDGSASRDPRFGSKKPIPLVLPTSLQQDHKDEKPNLNPAEELALLENDERLQDFLDALDDGEILHPEDQEWVDAQLARFNELVEILGIDVEDEFDDEEDA